MSQPGMVSHGLPPRPNEVQRNIRDIERRLNAMHGMVVQAVNGANAAAATANDAAATAQGAANTANDALSRMRGYNWYTNNFAVKTGGNGGSFPITQTITVPAGYTKLAYIANATATANNTTAGYDNLNAAIIVGGDNGFGGIYCSAPAGINATASATLAGHQTGLTPGSAITVELELWTFNGNWSQSTSNGAELSLLAIWQA